MKYCSKCGAELNDDAMFCKKCGSKFESVQQNEENLTAKINEQKAGSKILPIVCAVCIIGMLVLAGVSIYLNNERNEWQSMYYDKYDDVATLQSEVDALFDENLLLSQKSNFFDEYAVIVDDNGSTTYHAYDCPYCEKNSFWIYNVEKAEELGYHACPVCH